MSGTRQGCLPLPLPFNIVLPMWPGQKKKKKIRKGGREAGGVGWRKGIQIERLEQPPNKIRGWQVSTWIDG